jgi:hypothetical protein
VVDGKPLLEPGDKTLGVEFVSPAVGPQDQTTAQSAVRPGAQQQTRVDSSRVFMEFKVDKMMLNGQLIY